MIHQSIGTFVAQIDWKTWVGEKGFKHIISCEEELKYPLLH